MLFQYSFYFSSALLLGCEVGKLCIWNDYKSNWLFSFMNSELSSLLLAIIKVVSAAIYCITFELTSSFVYKFLATVVFMW
jgi:hypothetical protein